MHIPVVKSQSFYEGQVVLVQSAQLGYSGEVSQTFVTQLSSYEQEIESHKPVVTPQTSISSLEQGTESEHYGL